MAKKTATELTQEFEQEASKLKEDISRLQAEIDSLRSENLTLRSKATRWDKVLSNARVGENKRGERIWLLGMDAKSFPENLIADIDALGR